MSHERLAATEYAAVADPNLTTKTRFGYFTHDPRFLKRHDPNQLFDVRCKPEQLGDLLTSVEALYAPTRLNFRKLSGYYSTEILPKLESLSWSVQRTWMLTHTRPPIRSINPNVTVRPVNPHASTDLDVISHHPDTNSDNEAFRRAQETRLGGEVIVGYLNGEPVGKTGWFVVNGVVRFRGVFTVPEARNKGVASAMIHYVQTHPNVLEQATLCIHVGEDGPLKLYESLGFIKQAQMWEALKEQ